jgi:hypothetical protein
VDVLSGKPAAVFGGFSGSWTSTFVYRPPAGWSAWHRRAESGDDEIVDAAQVAFYLLAILH